jgi:glutamate:GABA antiporter
MQKKPKKISLFLLVLLIVSAIDSIRNLPASALFGSKLIFFFLFSALVFLIPTALVSAELSAAFPDQGGVYHWMTRAFGSKVGMLSIWLQWINTMVWYPTILAFIAGTATYLLNPDLANNKAYLISVILIVFWGLTIVNLFGLKVSATVNSICGLMGMMVPMVVLIILGIMWFAQGKPAHIYFSYDNVLPSFSHRSNWVSLTAIMASFLGIELAGVHVNDIKDPQKNFPRAMSYSTFFLVFTMLFGSLTIAYILPVENINLVAGVMQTFANFFQVFHIEWATPILAILILVGGIGSIINWLISPAKGLLHAAEYGFLPALFRKKNRYDVAYSILIAQGLLVSLFCLIFFLVPSINAFYWFLTGLSTNLYMLMYVLMFLSAIKLYYSFKNRPVSFRIPGKHLGLWMTSLLGIVGCAITIIVGFFPPDHMNLSIGYYAFLMTAGTTLMIIPVFLFYWYRKRQTHPHA